MGNNYLAQAAVPLGNLRGLGVIGLQGAAIDDPVEVFAMLISTIIGLLTIIAAIYFLINLIIGALGIISAGGDKAKYEDARKRITDGFVGLVITISAMFIMDLVTTLLGIPDILNIGLMISLIAP